jgi:DNA-binding ferritin-like protein
MAINFIKGKPNKSQVIGERTKNNRNPLEKGDEYTKRGTLSALIKTAKYKTKQQTKIQPTQNNDGDKYTHTMQEQMSRLFHS